MCPPLLDILALHQTDIMPAADEAAFFIAKH